MRSKNIYLISFFLSFCFWLQPSKSLPNSKIHLNSSEIDLSKNVRAHWLDDKYIYFAEHTVSRLEIETGLRVSIDLRGYTVKNLVVKDRVAFISARKIPLGESSTVTKRYLPVNSEDRYAAFACDFENRICAKIIEGNFLIDSFQPYETGYVYIKTLWENYSWFADFPAPSRSEIVVLRDSASTILSVGPGINRIYMSRNWDMYIDTGMSGNFKEAAFYILKINGVIEKVEDKLVDDRYVIWKNFNDFKFDGKRWVISTNKKEGIKYYIENKFCCVNGDVVSFVSNSYVFFENNQILFVQDGEVQKINPANLGKKD